MVSSRRGRSVDPTACESAMAGAYRPASVVAGVGRGAGGLVDALVEEEGEPDVGDGREGLHLAGRLHPDAAVGEEPPEGALLELEVRQLREGEQGDAHREEPAHLEQASL